MKIQLQDQVDLHSVDVVAIIERGVERPELALLCRQAHEGRLEPDDLRAHLPHLTPRACRNLVRSLQSLELCDPYEQLTPAGRECARTGVAFLAERRLVRLWMAHHEGLGTITLAWEALTGRQPGADGASPVPPELVPDGTVTWTSVLDGGRFRVRSLPSARRRPPFGHLRSRRQASVCWEIDGITGENAWRMEGDIEAARGRTRFRTEPCSAPARRLRGLMTRWEPAFDPVRQRWACGFDGRAPEGGVEDFLRPWQRVDVEVPGHGDWPEARVEQLPVGPRNTVDAEEWARALVLARLRAQDRFVHPPSLEALYATVIDASPLADFGPTPSTPQELASHADPRTRWQLLAPLDVPLEAP